MCFAPFDASGMSPGRPVARRAALSSRGALASTLSADEPSRPFQGRFFNSPTHDWFFAQGAIDQMHLTMEPVRFGTGAMAENG